MTVKKIANAIRKASKDKGLCNIVIEGEYYFTLNQLSGNSKLMKSIENLLEK